MHFGDTIEIVMLTTRLFQKGKQKIYQWEVSVGQIGYQLKKCLTLLKPNPFHALEITN